MKESESCSKNLKPDFLCVDNIHVKKVDEEEKEEEQLWYLLGVKQDGGPYEVGWTSTRVLSQFIKTCN